MIFASLSRVLSFSNCFLLYSFLHITSHTLIFIKFHEVYISSGITVFQGSFDFSLNRFIVFLCKKSFLSLAGSTRFLFIEFSKVEICIHLTTASQVCKLTYAHFKFTFHFLIDFTSYHFNSIQASRESSIS